MFHNNRYTISKLRHFVFEAAEASEAEGKSMVDTGTETAKASAISFDEFCVARSLSSLVCTYILNQISYVF